MVDASASSAAGVSTGAVSLQRLHLIRQVSFPSQQCCEAHQQYSFHVRLHKYMIVRFKLNDIIINIFDDTCL